MNRLLLMLVLLTFVPMAHAAKPDMYTDEYGFILEIVDCGDFSVMDNIWEVDKIKDFYDNEGNFMRSQINITAWDDIYRHDDIDGPHLYGTAHVMARWTLDGNGDWFDTQSGLAVAITVPGEGQLFFDAGRLIYNVSNGWELIFSAGRHHDWNFEEYEVLCNYFE